MYRDHSGELMPIIARCASGPSARRARARRLAHVVPDLLGVDQHAVEVEDDGLDHSAGVAPVDVDERAAPRARLERQHLADEERVVAGRDLVDRARHSASRAAPASSRGSSSRTSMPSQSTIGGTLAREVLGECSWLAGEHRDAPLARVAQHLVERGFERERDADERRLERERDERRDRQSGAAPADSATTTETPAGQRRKSARCSAPRSATRARLASAGRVSCAALTSPSCVISAFFSRSVALSYAPGGVALPHHVRRDARATMVARYCVPLPAGCAPCGLNE